MIIIIIFFLKIGTDARVSGSTAAEAQQNVCFLIHQKD